MQSAQVIEQHDLGDLVRAYIRTKGDFSHAMQVVSRYMQAKKSPIQI